MKPRILWIDDEIVTLEPLIKLLENAGYHVIPAASGDKGIEILLNDHIDLVLLDEIMPGKDGLAVLNDMHALGIDVPVVMVTKVEDADFITETLSKKVAGFVIKPIKFAQLYAVVKQILEQPQLVEKELPKEYTKFYNNVMECLNRGDITPEGWINIYKSLLKWDISIDIPGFHELHDGLWEKVEKHFSQYVEQHYKDWIEGTGPLLSPYVVKEELLPFLCEHKRVLFLLIDCMRFDIWWAIKKELTPMYHIDESAYYSILPTATPFARNAIFSGEFPLDFVKKYPDAWRNNECERPAFLKRGGDTKNVAFVKIIKSEDAGVLPDILDNYKRYPLIVVVVNLIDLLVHRPKQGLLYEVVQDIKGLRDLSALWFSKSMLLNFIRGLHSRGYAIFLTTDHGAILGRKGVKIYGGEHISPSLRYKYDRFIKVEDKRAAMLINEPREYKLAPENMKFAIAKEDYFFIYPTHPDVYEKRYKFLFQHGGISLQEMIIPLVKLEPL